MDDLHALKSALRSDCGGHGMKQTSAVKKLHTHGIDGLDAILELGNALHDKLLLIDEHSGTSSDSLSDEDGRSGLEDENISNHDLNSGTFSANSKGQEPESQQEDCKDQSRSLSIPSSRKLVPAIKGSREKEGVPQKKLSVSWAPDVYDPPPTSISHFPKKKNQQHCSKSHKKHGKGKQKGKSVPKEKKRYRKMSGRSDWYLDSFVETGRVHNYKSSLELLDFSDPGTVSPDPNCGSKFIGQASGTMHCFY